jgi:hypothetical protein
MSLTSTGALRWQFDLAPNDNGLILPSAPIIGTNGVIYVAGGNTRFFFAIGVPEPSACVLLIFGSFFWFARHPVKMSAKFTPRYVPTELAKN